MKNKIELKDVMGILVSVIVGLISFWITKDSVTSFLIGLVVECLALLVEQKIEIIKAKDEILGAMSLSDTITHNPTLKKLIVDYDHVRKNGDVLFSARAQEVLQDAFDNLAGLDRGYMKISGSLITYKGTALISALQKGGIATSIIKKVDDWASPEAINYHKVTIQQALLGKKITRIFVYDDIETLLGYGIVKVMKEQEDSGITIRCVSVNELDTDMLKDVGLWDDKLVCTIELSPRGDTVFAIYDTSQSTIRETKELLDRILIRSHSLSDVL